MKKWFVLFISIILIASCGLLFTTNETKSIDTLALSGGGYLSTDEYNEITPFVFRDTNGSAYLFFSSDRAGTYDIYYSIMNPDGTFEKPVALTNSINQTNSDEIYPVVFFDPNMLVYVIGFIRISNDITNLHAIDSYDSLFTDIANYNFSDAFSITGLGIIESETGVIPLMSSNHSSRLYYLSFSDGILIDPSTNLQTECYSANGFTIPIQNGHSDIYIKTVMTRGKFQLAAEMYSKTSVTITQTLPPYLITNITTYIPTTIPVDAYLSKFNDMSPFVDTKDGYKVYFASDRYDGDSHKGDYDLYRYNVLTFFNLPATSGIIPLDTSKPTVSFIGVINGETNYDGYFNMPIEVLDNTCEAYFTKVYLSTNGAKFFEIPYSYYSSFDQLWYFYYLFGLTGFYSLNSYAVDWFGNVSSTNSITIYFWSI